MTSHELARYLLENQDLPVVVWDCSVQHYVKIGRVMPDNAVYQEFAEEGDQLTVAETAAQRKFATKVLVIE